MYSDILSDRMRELFERASAEVTLEAEIRLVRARLAKALEEEPPDDRAVSSALDLLTKLVRTQAQNGGDPGELSRMIERIAEEIRLEQSQS